MPLRKLAKSIISLLLTLLALEALVRVKDIDHRILGDPFKVQEKDIILHYLAVDSFLQWRGRVGTPLMQPSEVISSQGLRSPEISRKKPPRVRRIAALGDSCTFGFVAMGKFDFQTPRPYPALLQDLLDRNLGPGRFQVINYGLIGYTTYHGLRMLRREVLPDDPDFVVIRFGWNDLIGSPTSRSFANVHNPWLERLEDLAYHSRLIGLLLYRGSPVDPRSRAPWTVSAHPVPWVTPEEYAWNLGRMIDLARAHGAKPILLDAPAAPITPEIRANKDFIGGVRYGTIEQFLAAHDRYQAITARVARDKGVPFLHTTPPPEKAFQYFSRYDIPHPSAGGQERIAQRLYAEIISILAREGAL